MTMQKIKTDAMVYLPKEFIDIADEFIDVCGKRAGTYHRVGGCTSILNRNEIKEYWTNWEKPSTQHSSVSSSPITMEIKEVMTKFCNKYVVLMEVLYRDKELNQWCRNYSAYRRNTEHCELEKIIYETPGAEYLGEVALVQNDSPISNTGLVFNTTLYDENASCHLALGRGFLKTFPGSETATDEELHEKGLNLCKNHIDFMIGTPDLDITAQTSEGQKLVFKKGNFNI
jgi:hypothetical protein